MPNALVRNVLTTLILVVLCIVVGAEAAENTKSALGIISGLVGAVFLIWMGPRCWVLLYLLPPIMTLLPLPGKIAELPVSYVVAVVVLFYWVVMWFMGYVRFKWRSLLVMDLLILLVFLYMAYSYSLHPVSMAIFGYDAEFIGGKEYVWCIVATIYYMAISCVPCTYEQLKRVFKWAIRLSLAVCCLTIALNLLGVRGGTDITELGDAAMNTRFSMFVKISTYGIFFLYGCNPMLKVLTSAKLLGGCMLCILGILLSGWREVLMSSSFSIMALAIVKRELWCITLLGALAYGGLLYLSAEGIIEKAPFGVQRCLSVAPGIKISQEVKSNTEHSSEWRVEMWRWALDSRTGYIRDYVWGDGFGQSVDYLRRETVAMMRGTAMYGDQDFFANTGTWHSGVITSIHRLGYVGLAIISLVYLYGFCMMLRVCMALKGTALYFPAIFFLMPFGGEPSLFYISAGTIPKFFQIYIYLATIKLLYCVGREQGFIIPIGLQQRYVPLVIREQEAQS